MGIGLIVAVLLAAATHERAVLQGDVNVYADRIASFAGGALPYLDAPFEHLPLSLLPLLAAAGLDQVPGITLGAALAFVNASLLIGAAATADRLGQLEGLNEAVTRWLIVAVPVFPVVLFRLDPFSLLLAGLALVALLDDRRSASLTASALGVGARGWPIVLAVPMWQRGWRREVIVLGAGTVALSAWLLATPGFTSGREFTGVHLETVAGSAMLVFDHVAGETLGITSTAGALYIGGGVAPAILNAAVAVVVSAVALRRAGRRSTIPTPAALAILTYALLLASPLLSAQMLLWPTLFVAVSVAAPIALVAACGVATTALLTVWEPTALWWAGLLVVRNAALLATPLVLASRIGTPAQPSSSRKNLPV